ncbi:MAG: hypothetical protein IIY94_07030 [Oscillospiraceae bacterium]|nr:hypothetical protein [Oscillospiraceae bacterium]
MDLQTEQAVWARVKGPGGIPAEQALLPERLEALILEQRADAASLRALSRQMRGQGSASVSRMAQRTDARAQKLTTLHYLLTGRQLRLQSPKLPPQGPLPEALRQAWLRTRQAAKAYEALREEFSDYAEDFADYAADAKNDGRSLEGILRQQMASERQ